MVPPVRIDGIEPVLGDVPAVGQHTEAILREIGIETSVVNAWRREGII